jgi:hypothetical protein
MKVPRRFPVEVNSGPVTIKIYRSKNAKGYTTFAVPYRIGNQPRVVKTFSEYADAYAEAKGVGEKIRAGQVESPN